jgi:hypothetical protein
MARNTAVRSGSTSTQVIVRPAQANLIRSTSKHRKDPRKTAKRGSYLPETKILRIQQRYVAGENRSEIAKKEKVDRGTVARIVRFPEMRSFIARMQEELFAIAPDALASFHAQVKMDGRLAYVFLKDLQIIPTREALAQFLNATTTSSETGFQRQCRLIASVLFEANQQMGVELGPEIEKALAESTDCEHATAGARSLRSVKDAGR